MRPNTSRCSPARRDAASRVTLLVTLHSIRLLSQPIEGPLLEGPLSGRIVDISKHGIKMRTSIGFFPGSKLQLFLKEVVIVGEVRYCKPTTPGFEHGILIEETFGGSISCESD